jgi:hypothetical protein
MNRCVFILLLFVVDGCSRSDPVGRGNGETTTAEGTSTVHPKVDFEHWASVFPIEIFQKTSGPRQFSTTEKGSPLDLWKPSGEIITSPAHLCNVELVRKQYAQTKDLGSPVPVDIFLWSVKAAEKPFLTKLGGVPHRETIKPWPKDTNDKPYTFVAQYCFADSKDIISNKIPGDVMLVFFKDANSVYDPEAIHVEWSSIELDSPMTADECPKPSFVVPQLSGHIHRTNEYPESRDVFEQEGHYQCYLFPTTQASKIGRETFFTQHDPRRPGDELICTLNSVHPSQGKWPFIDLEALPNDWDQPDDHYGWGRYRMMFADVGCLYFVIDEEGTVSWSMDSY